MTKLEALRKEIHDCVRCGFCRIWEWAGVEHVCPTYPFTDGWDTQYARGRVRLARATMNEEVEITEQFLEHVYECTLCSNCETHCPVEVKLHDIFMAFRHDLVEKGHVLPGHQRLTDTTLEHLNPYGPPKSADAHEIKKAEVIFYPGCTPMRKIDAMVQGGVQILKKLGLEYDIFYEDTCCGLPLYEIGQTDAAREVAEKTVELIMKHEPKVLLTSCPSCYLAFKSTIPEEFGIPIDFEVWQVAELLPKLEGILTNGEKKIVTWHDPCVLGRHQGIYEEPRQLISAIPGVELVEMAANREHSLCCGGGGGTSAVSSKITLETSAYRLNQAVEAGAEVIVSSCPNCTARFDQAARRFKIDIKAMTLSELVGSAV